MQDVILLVPGSTCTCTPTEVTYRIVIEGSVSYEFAHRLIGEMVINYTSACYVCIIHAIKLPQ